MREGRRPAGRSGTCRAGANPAGGPRSGRPAAGRGARRGTRRSNSPGDGRLAAAAGKERGPRRADGRGARTMITWGLGRAWRARRRTVAFRLRRSSRPDLALTGWTARLPSQHGGGAGVVEPRPRGRLGRLAGEPSPTGARTGPSPWPAPGGPSAIETGGRLCGAADLVYLAGVLAIRGRRRVRDGRPRDRPRRRPAPRRERHDAVRRRRALAAARSGGPRLRPPAGPGNRRYPAPGVESDAQLRRAWGRTVRLPFPTTAAQDRAGLSGSRCPEGLSRVGPSSPTGDRDPSCRRASAAG